MDNNKTLEDFVPNNKSVYSKSFDGVSKGEKIKEYGYPNVFNLYGGIFEWKNHNLEIVNNNKITDSIHIFSKKWSKWVQNGIKVY